MQEQSGPGPQTAAEVLPVSVAATTPAAPAVQSGFVLQRDSKISQIS